MGTRTSNPSSRSFWRVITEVCGLALANGESLWNSLNERIRGLDNFSPKKNPSQTKEAGATAPQKKTTAKIIKKPYP